MCGIEVHVVMECAVEYRLAAVKFEAVALNWIQLPANIIVATCPVTWLHYSVFAYLAVVNSHSVSASGQ